MDYIKELEYLKNRYTAVDKNGMYISYGPVYGFCNKHEYIGIYKNNYSILRAIKTLMSDYDIKSFLEAGCAEAHTSHLIKEALGFDNIEICDMSPEAVARAGDLYGFKGFSANIEDLSIIKDEQYDLVLCSETLEHVADPEKAFKELLRVTRKVLLITVPSAKDKSIEKNYIPLKKFQSHLRVFSKESLKELAQPYTIEIRGIHNSILNRIEWLFASGNDGFKAARQGILMRLLRLVRFLLTPIRKLYGPKILRVFIVMDYFLCGIFKQNVFTYIGVIRKKDKERDQKQKKINFLDIMLYKSAVRPIFLNRN